MGVGALELFCDCRASPYMPSRKHEADRICPSEASAALRDDINEGLLEEWSVCLSRDWYRRSTDSWVRPRCDFEPRIVWLYDPLAPSSSTITEPCPQTLPEPVTPNVATRPSLPSPITPSTRGTIPVPRNISSCDASSSKTLVKANFSTARFRDSLGGWIVI